MKELALAISGMTCGHCVEGVTKALKTVPGVEVMAVTVGRATVRADETTASEERIVQAIKAAGYEATLAGAKPAASSQPQDHGHHGHGQPQASLTSLAFSATAHCLTGCAIGEILGMVIGTYFGLANVTTVGLSVVLAFLFGYALTLKPLLGAGLPFSTALGLALASDTLSIATMEVVDNLVMLVIPGAMDAGIFTALFWGSLALSLALAFFAAVPVNRWLLSQGKGHAVVHRYHQASAGHSG